jgi:hypothetical protein
MPESFQNFLSHVASYKAVTKAWEEAEKAEKLDALGEKDHVGVVKFPNQFHDDVEAAYVALRKRQLELISITTE